MGTRADFYVGSGRSAEWLGSIAFDGYPEGYPKGLRLAASEAEFRDGVWRIAETIADKGYSHFTQPSDGWPWPWASSLGTDMAYTWHDGGSLISRYGSEWIPWDEYFELQKQDVEPPPSTPDQFPVFDTSNFAMPGNARSGMLAIVSRR